MSSTPGATIRQIADVTIIDIHDPMFSFAGAIALREVMPSLLAEGRTKLLVNLTEATEAKAAGLGQLFCSQEIANKQSAVVKVVARGHVLKVLEITGISTAFEVFSDEAEATRSFSSGTGS
jgi:anti-anti-sigma regulatory factor